jgi:putative Holliday junction resolvase
MAASAGTILALDIGTVRIGVARASSVARLAEPLTTLRHDDMIFDNLREICQQEDVTQLVVGLPRGLDGQTTAQTDYALDFVQKLADELKLPISLVDEAVTSRQAESELLARGKQFKKGDIDALAAVYILEDYLQTTGRK